jgi:hypothetical protein
MDADVFIVAMRLHQKPSQRQFSLKLLYSIIPHLSHVIVLNQKLAEELFSLFESVLGFRNLHQKLTFFAQRPRR